MATSLIIAPSVSAKDGQHEVDSTKREMTPVDFLSIPRLSDVSLSPDGETIAYFVRRPDWESNRLRKTLWLHPFGQAPRQIGKGLSDMSELRWSPDGAHLSLIANEKEGVDDQVYVISVYGGEAQQLTKHCEGVAEFQWSNDGKSLFYLARRESQKDDSLRYRLKPFDSKSFRHLWKLDIATGEAKCLTGDEIHIRHFSISPSNDQLILECASGALADDRHTSGSLWSIASDGTKLRRLTNAVHAYNSAQLSPSGATVLFLAPVNDQGENYYEPNLFLIDAKNPSGKRELLADFPHEITAARWGPTDETILLICNLGVTNQLYELKLPGEELRQLTEGNHNLLDWDYASSAGVVALQVRDVESKGDVWQVNVSHAASRSSKEPMPIKQWTHLFDYVARQFILPEQRLITWQAPDGQRVEALLTTPKNAPKDKPLPLIVQSHGGPRLSERYGIWKWKNQQPLLANKGYATVMPNYRGSRGYGDEFLRDMVGNYFRNAHTDVLSCVDHLVEVGIADPNRLGAMGWSAGGHMTNKLITVTNRFKAASSGAGAVDWVSMYGESDIRYLRMHWFGGSPWEKDAPLKSYRDQSPLKDLWQAKTPTLIFVGEDDPRVPRTQSVLLCRALTANGVPNRLYVAPEMKHDWTKPDLRLFKLNREMEWFEEHINNRGFEWQEMPAEAVE